MTKTKANARTDFCIGRQTCPSLAPGRLPQRRVFFFLFSSSSSSSLSSSSIYEYTSWWVYRPQFPEQSVLPFSIFPAPDLPSCIYDVPLTCILLLLFFLLFFSFFMVRITATHLSALSLPWTTQYDHIILKLPFGSSLTMK